MVVEFHNSPELLQITTNATLKSVMMDQHLGFDFTNDGETP